MASQEGEGRQAARGSQEKLPWRDGLDVTGVALTSLVSKAAAPLSLIALSRGEHQAALISAAIVGCVGALQGVVGGRAIQRAERRAWSFLVAGVRKNDVATLRVRSLDESAALLSHATTRTAQIRATIVPELIANALGLVVVAVATVVFLGWSWLLFGVAVAGVLGSLIAVGHRRLRNVERAGWGLYPELLRDATVLIDGSTEVRAQGYEAALAERLLASASSKAALHRKATTTSAVLSLLPLAIALAVFALSAFPLGLIEESGAARLLGGGVIDAAVLGGAAVLFGISLSRKVEAYMRAEPQRRLFARFIAGSGAILGAARRDPDDAEPMPSDSDVRFENVSVRYAGADVCTPSRFSFVWESGRGLAVLGPNGSGKSTLALALVGLIEPTDGNITGAASTESRASLRRTIFLPQQPLCVPTESVRWHLRNFGTSSVSDAELEVALRRFELWERLAHRAENSPLDIPAGELSGGERQRMELAKILLPVDAQPADLIVLDEPEAGLDAGARSILCDVLRERAHTTRVLLIAHDPSVVPADFQRAYCERGDADGVAVSHVRGLGGVGAETDAPLGARG